MALQRSEILGVTMINFDLFGTEPTYIENMLPTEFGVPAKSTRAQEDYVEGETSYFNLAYPEQQHINMLAIENIIANTAPTFYGRWVQESYKEFTEANNGKDIELIMHKVVDHYYGEDTDMVSTPQVFMTTHAMSTGQATCYGHSDEANEQIRLNILANNMGLLRNSDKVTGNYRVIDQTGYFVTDDLEKAFSSLLHQCSFIFIQEQIFTENETLLRKMIDELKVEGKYKVPAGIAVI